MRRTKPPDKMDMVLYGLETIYIRIRKGEYFMAKLQDSIDALEQMVERNDAAVMAAVAKLQEGIQALEEQKDDPEEVQAIIDRLSGTVSKLEAAVTTNPQEQPTVTPEQIQEDTFTEGSQDSTLGEQS